MTQWKSMSRATLSSTLRCSTKALLSPRRSATSFTCTASCRRISARLRSRQRVVSIFSTHSPPTYSDTPFFVIYARASQERRHLCRLTLSSLERRTRVAGDNADRLLAELRLVGVDHRRKPPREIGLWLGCDEQDFGWAAGDLAGLRVAPLALSIEDGEAVGEVWRDGLRRKFRPFGIGQRLAPLDIAGEEKFSDEHVLFGRQ